MTGLIVVAVVACAVVALIVLYNNMVKLRNKVDNAWSQVDVQMQRRFDLIPNMVETAKGYAVHESKTLEGVTAARSAFATATDARGKMAADTALTGALRGLFAVSEAYPELKADENFRQLSAELSDTEDKISYMRQSYNDTVMKYNTAIQTFPAVLFAKMFGFEERESFDAVAAASDAPRVSF